MEKRVANLESICYNGRRKETSLLSDEPCAAGRGAMGFVVLLTGRLEEALRNLVQIGQLELKVRCWLGWRGVAPSRAERGAHLAQ